MPSWQWFRPCTSKQHSVPMKAPRAIFNFVLPAIFIFFLFHSPSFSEEATPPKPTTELLDKVKLEQEAFKKQTAEQGEELKKKKDKCAANPKDPDCIRIPDQEKQVKKAEQQAAANDKAIAEAQKVIDMSGTESAAAKDAVSKAAQSNRETLEKIAGGQVLYDDPKTAPSYENIAQWTNRDSDMARVQMNAADTPQEAFKAGKDIITNSYSLQEAGKVLAADGDMTAPQPVKIPQATLGEPTSQAPSLSSGNSSSPSTPSSFSSGADAATGSTTTNVPITPVQATSVAAPTGSASSYNPPPNSGTASSAAKPTGSTQTRTPITPVQATSATAPTGSASSYNPPTNSGTASSAAKTSGYQTSSNVGSNAQTNSVASRPTTTSVAPRSSTGTPMTTTSTVNSVQRTVSGQPIYQTNNGYTYYPMQTQNGQIQYFPVYSGNGYHNGSQNCSVYNVCR